MKIITGWKFMESDEEFIAHTVEELKTYLEENFEDEDVVVDWAVDNLSKAELVDMIQRGDDFDTLKDKFWDWIKPGDDVGMYEWCVVKIQDESESDESQ